MDDLKAKDHSHYFYDAECTVCVARDGHYKRAEKPNYDIKHAGQIPGVCECCNRPPVEFVVSANQHFSIVRFYCHDHYMLATNAALREKTHA